MPRRKGVPKRPRSAYVLFKKAYRIENIETFKTMPASEFAAIAKKKWDHANKHVREMYENLAKYDKLRHENEMNDVFEKPKTKKRLPNAYSLYIKENMHALMKEHGISLATACKELATKWKAMTDEEKHPYHKKYKKLTNTKYKNQDTSSLIKSFI